MCLWYLCRMTLGSNKITTDIYQARSSLPVVRGTPSKISSLTSPMLIKKAEVCQMVLKDSFYPSTPFDKLPKKQEHGAIWRWLHGKD